MNYAVFDTETDGLSIFKGAQPFLYGMRKDGEDQITYNDEEVADDLEDPTLDKVGHNLKFDILMMKSKGREVYGKLWDTMLMLHVLESFERVSLLEGTKRWAPEHLKKVDLIEEWFKMNGVKRDDRNYTMLPKSLIEPYLVGDLDSTETLFKVLMEEIVKRGLLPLLEQECALIYVLVDMHMVGIKVDIDYLTELADRYISNIEKLEQIIYQSAGCEFDILSARQLAKILLAAGASLPLTEKGNYSCSEASLQEVEHPLAKMVVDYRHQSKFFSTYIMGLLKEQKDDIIHCDLLQHGTVTGRFSSREPNMQNIPRDDKDIRRAFIPRSEDFNLFFIDYKQMEYRVFLDYIKEDELIRKINEEDADYHQLIFEQLKPYIKSDKWDRKLAKGFNFTLIYGAGIGKIAEMLGLSYDMAKAIRDLYFSKMDKVKPFFKQIEHTILVRTLGSPYPGKGYIKNKYGRMYWLEPREAYKAVNYLVQGTCADMVKEAMIKVHALLKPYKSNLLLQIHDELILEIHKDERFLVPKIAAIMEDFSHMFKVKIGVDISWSKDNWGNKEEYNV